MIHHRSSSVRFAAGIALALLATASGPVLAQVASLTVGLNTPCPNGVPN
jgi:hypothetical protein